MKNLNFSPLKKLEIILGGEHRSFATDLLDRAVFAEAEALAEHARSRGCKGLHDHQQPVRQG